MEETYGSEGYDGKELGYSQDADVEEFPIQLEVLETYFI